MKLGWIPKLCEQQGTEALVKLLKHIYQHCTNKGGPQQVKGQPHGTQSPGHRAKDIWQILMRIYGWHNEHLQKLFDADHERVVEKLVNMAYAEFGDDGDSGDSEYDGSADGAAPSDDGDAGYEDDEDDEGSPFYDELLPPIAPEHVRRTDRRSVADRSKGNGRAKST